MLFHLSFHSATRLGAQGRVNPFPALTGNSFLLSGSLDLPGFGEVSGSPCRSSCGRSFGKTSQDWSHQPWEHSCSHADATGSNLLAEPLAAFQRAPSRPAGKLGPPRRWL